MVKTIAKNVGYTFVGAGVLGLAFLLGTHRLQLVFAVGALAVGVCWFVGKVIFAKG
jgi:hypothetical protein